jgi:hypothetical protein
MAGMSRLEAINLMLGNIGESPVSSLTGSTDVFVVQCESILDETTRAVQAKKWHFNRDKDYAMAPDSSGFINIPDNIITVDTTARSMSKDVCVRAGKLYDIGEQTNVFTEPVYTDVVWEFPFIETPQWIRQYLAVRAARVFASRQLGDVTSERLTVDDEIEARADAKANDLRIKDRNIFDNFNSVGRIRHRRIQ